tara:strand:- start:131 stop:535 length:405 start_codon:yes stop_codon:yes gene_type:complete
MLQQKIKDKKLTNHVFLKGATNHIKNKMLSSSLFVMTSDNECFPLVLLEAQACGLPIISFDCPNGPRHIINTENGILIPPGDINGFSEAILDMISNSDKRKTFGENTRLNSAKYAVDVVMAQWVKMFDVLTKNK